MSDLSLKSRSSDEEEEDLDMTPMVDVTFLLLIFFMITAAFALQKAMEVPPVDEDEAAPVEVIEEEETDMITVRLDEDNIYWITAPSVFEDKEAASRQDMRDLIREAREGGDSGTPFNKLLLQAHGDATHEYMVAALDAGAANSIEELSLLIYEDGDL